MPKPMIRIHDVETGEIVDREMTAAEIKNHEANIAALEAIKDENAVKATTKAAVLAKLGLTADEVAALLG
jgi:hypothetical protein